MANSQRTSKPINFVQQDECWKEHVKVVKDSAEAWSNKWGFLTDIYKEYEMESKKLVEEAKKLKLPHYLEPRPPTPPEKNIQVGPSPPFPKTSQGMIGWRSSHAHLQLEKFGQVHYGKRDFLKGLGWPQDYSQ